ncbi:hypothetical protein BGZ92_000752 [Podila epicladia]|nr:hypothetical protein BGZ92_000752 [Podila epicladia]
MNPKGGAGALTAMHDAVTLANWMYTVEAPSRPEIEDIFKEYRAERYSVDKEAFETSQVFTKSIEKAAMTKAMRRPSLEKTRAILQVRASAIAQARNGKRVPVFV